MLAKRFSCYSCYSYFLLACASTPSVTSAPGQPGASCVIAAAEGAARESLSVVVTSSFDARRILNPHTAAEQFVYAQTHRTLVGIDCAGRPIPMLARAWSHDAATGRWTLDLRDGAFWDGAVVTASDVLASWRATAADSAATLAQRVAAAAEVINTTTLSVRIADSSARIFAHPQLAVYRPGASWDAGTGPFQIMSPRPDARTALTLTSADGSATAQRVTIRMLAAADARDAMDAGADIVLTDDPNVVAYARARMDFATTSLSWQHTYVMIASIARQAESGPALAILRAGLARDVVPADARPAELPWWGNTSCILDVSNATSTAGGSARVVYPINDRVARSIAERIVATATRLSAAGVSDDELAASLRSRSDAVYIIALSRESAAPCDDLHALTTAAPWVSASSIIPLVDTRHHLIMRPGRASLSTDWQGVLRLAGSAGRRVQIRVP